MKTFDCKTGPIHNETVFELFSLQKKNYTVYMVPATYIYYCIPSIINSPHTGGRNYNNIRIIYLYSLGTTLALRYPHI